MMDEQEEPVPRRVHHSAVKGMTLTCSVRHGDPWRHHARVKGDTPCCVSGPHGTRWTRACTVGPPHLSGSQPFLPVMGTCKTYSPSNFQIHESMFPSRAPGPFLRALANTCHLLSMS